MCKAEIMHVKHGVHSIDTVYVSVFATDKSRIFVYCKHGENSTVRQQFSKGYPKSIRGNMCKVGVSVVDMFH